MDIRISTWHVPTGDTSWTMAVSVLTLPVRALSLRRADRAGSVIGMSRSAHDIGWFGRVSKATAIAYCVSPPSSDLALIATVYGSNAHSGLWALGATMCYLPLHVRNVWYAMHGRRPPGGLASLMVIAVAGIGGVPLVGDVWLRAFGGLAVSAWIVLRPPWSRVATAVVVTVPLVLAAARIDGPNAWWIGAQPLFRAAFLFALIWLAAALQQLRAAQQLLAEQALEHERERIDSDMQRAVGAALESIAARGQQASARAGSDEVSLEGDLHDLVEESRRTLAEARRTLRRYQQASLKAELGTAASLLTAAGIETTVRHGVGRLSDDAEQAMREELRTATANLLRDRTARSCVISVTRDGRLHLEVSDRAAVEMDVT
jgi:two-component system sensor histidine kinase DesK